MKTFFIALAIGAIANLIEYGINAGLLNIKQEPFIIWEIKRGDSFFVPAGYGKYILKGNIEIVVTNI